MPKSNPNNGGFIRAEAENDIGQGMKSRGGMSRDDFKLISVKSTWKDLIRKSVIIEFFATTGVNRGFPLGAHFN